MPRASAPGSLHRRRRPAPPAAGAPPRPPRPRPAARAPPPRRRRPPPRAGGARLWRRALSVAMGAVLALAGCTVSVPQPPFPAGTTILRLAHIDADPAEDVAAGWFA